MDPPSALHALRVAHSNIGNDGAEYDVVGEDHPERGSVIAGHVLTEWMRLSTWVEDYFSNTQLEDALTRFKRSEMRTLKLRYTR